MARKRFVDAVYLQVWITSLSTASDLAQITGESENIAVCRSRLFDKILNLKVDKRVPKS